ncbi:probable G-protein coupled receptor 160 [Notolabrus celidotus]|uniref:probable G-protein coupled receptor 160 n=1 Tax=Notolabrus celidotus TaxID=1203425 RepID=UPI00148F8622|nr:probable G-protein coupled receptor 160 [Notolabrus celidotus]
MLAIIEQWDAQAGCYMDNTEKFLLLLISKLVLDVLVFYFCCQKRYTFFLNMCSLSILLLDFLVVFLIATVWLLGPDKSLFSPCFILANASATYGALPLPMMLLGSIDYCLGDASLYNQSSFSKLVRNTVLSLLVLILAVIGTFGPVKAQMIKLDDDIRTSVVVCKLDGSSVITYFVWGVFLAVICALLPFFSKIPCWMKEAYRISEAREEQEKRRSDLLFTQTNCMDTKHSEENYLEETDQQRPPLWLSLTLSFGFFWMPYLTVSVACLLIGFAVPAYLTVNIIWLECANSLLLGLVFWVKSKTLGPYSHLPDHVGSWHIFWHLSKGTQRQQNPMGVYDPSKEKKSTLLWV